MTRPGWGDTWMAVADVMALRSPCTRAQVGAVIVDPNDRIVATGYNGAPAGFRVRGLFADEPRARRLSVGSCTEWCPHSTTANPSPCYDDCFSIHAEANALMFCDRREREGGSLYVTTSPCWMCAKQVANSGLARVWMRRGPEYRKPDEAMTLLKDCGLEVGVWRD